MKRKILALVICLVVLSLPAHARAKMEDDTKVYYEVIDEWSKLPAEELTEVSREDYDVVYGIVAKKNNMSASEVEDIAGEVYGRGLSKWEQGVFNEADKKFNSLPEDATEEDSDKLAQKIADKYGVSRAVLDEVMWRGLEARMGNIEE